MGYKLRISPKAKDYIADKGYDVQYGARPLKRAIQKYLEDEMAEVILKAEMVEGDIISITYDKKVENVKIRIESSKKPAEIKEKEEENEE